MGKWGTNSGTISLMFHLRKCGGDKETRQKTPVLLNQKWQTLTGIMKRESARVMKVEMDLRILLAAHL